MMICARNLLLPAAALAAVMGTAHADAAIVAVNDGKIGGAAPPASGLVSSAITVGANADMLIVMTSSELGNLSVSSPPLTVTYGGVAMNLAVGNLTASAIWYLDLSTPGISGTTVSFNMSGYSTKNGFAAGWVSIDGNLGAGESIALHSTGTSAATSNFVNLTTTVETFNAVNFNANATSSPPGPTLGAPIQAEDVIYSDEDIGSARGAAAFDESVAAGTTAYSWNIGVAAPNANYRRIDAAAFTVVPEPSSLALMGIGGLMMIKRRRRD